MHNMFKGKTKNREKEREDDEEDEIELEAKVVSDRDTLSSYRKTVNKSLESRNPVISNGSTNNSSFGSMVQYFRMSSGTRNKLAKVKKQRSKVSLPVTRSLPLTNKTGSELTTTFKEPPRIDSNWIREHTQHVKDIEDNQNLEQGSYFNKSAISFIPRRKECCCQEFLIAFVLCSVVSLIVLAVSLLVYYLN